MAHKYVCLDCRKAFSETTNLEVREVAICPQCSKQMVFLPHRFRPPKMTDVKKWEVVKFLIEQGFYYQHISQEVINEDGITITNYAEYPGNMRDAKEFVEKFKSQFK